MLESLKTSCDPQLNSVDSRSPQKASGTNVICGNPYTNVFAGYPFISNDWFVFIAPETGGGRVAVEADEEKDLVEQEEDLSTRSKVEDEEEASTRSKVEDEEEVSTR